MRGSRKYYTGRYALVDKTNRNIWLNIYNRDLALEVCAVFVSKITLMVVDLSTYANYETDPPSIDSDTCLDWQIPPAQHIQQISLSIYDHPNSQVYENHTEQPLINQVSRSLLTRSRQLELQDQLITYVELREQDFWNRPDQDTALALQHTQQIFMTHIHLSDIESHMINWCQQNPNLASLCILHFFDSLYA